MTAPVPPSFVTALINRSTPAGHLFDGQFCTGALIAPDEVLTATHCVEHRALTGVDVVVGVHDLCTAGPTERLHVVSSRVPDGLSGADAVVLRLARPSSGASALTSSVTSGPLTSWGWGRFEEGGVAPCEVQPVRLSLLHPAACTAISTATRLGFTAARQFCARAVKGSRRGNCAGDSGGPVLDAHARVVGVISYGAGCGAADPNVYARTAGLPNS